MAEVQPGGSVAVMGLDETIDFVGFGTWQYIMIAAFGIAFTADAFEVMLLSFLGPMVRCEWGISPEAEATLSTVVFFGTAIGAYIGGALSDRVGRRNVVICGSIFLFLAGVATAGAPSYVFLVFFRFLAGIGIGSLHTSFTYFMEAMPSHGRGRWGVLMMLWWSVGTVVEAVMAWVILPTYGWRVLVVASALPLIALAAAYCCLPKSPRFLLAKGRVEQATAVMRRIAKVNHKTLPPGFKLRAPAASSTAPSSLFPSLFSRAFRSTTLLLWVIWVVNALAYYGLVLLTTELSVDGTTAAAAAAAAAAGHNGTLPSNTSSLTTAATPLPGCDAAAGQVPFTNDGFLQIFIASVAEFPGILLCALVIDKLGRRWSQAVCFFGTALFLLLLLAPWPGAQTALLFCGRALITGGFSVTWVYTPEVYPTAFRSGGLGMCSLMARIGGMVAPFLGEALVEEHQMNLSLLIFTGCCMVAGAAALCLKVETSGAGMSEAQSCAPTPVSRRAELGMTQFSQLEDSDPSSDSDTI